MGKTVGCDIHSIIEVEDGGTVRAIETNWQQDRNYGLFGLLCGVRYYEERMHGVKPIKEPTYELPRSPEGIEQYERWAGDAHSLTQFTLDELEEAARRYPNIDPEYPKSLDLDVIVEQMRGLDPDHTGKAKLVVWFDN